MQITYSYTENILPLMFLRLQMPVYCCLNGAHLLRNINQH